MRETDVRVYDYGTIWTFELLTEAARDWREDHVPDVPDYMLTDTGFHADWRPGRDIAHGMIGDGLNVEKI